MVSKHRQIGKARTCSFGCCGWKDKRKINRYLRRIAKQKIRNA